jgi:hypothetical protein
LPADGHTYEMEDWMEALESIQGRIYGYEVAGRQSFFFPVYFDGVGRTRRIRHGNLINKGLLHGQTVKRDIPPLIGRWRIASFDTHEEAEVHDSPTPVEVSPFATYYKTLGLGMNADITLVKKAYRDLARQYHPDVSSATDAVVRMKEINEAYRRLIHHLNG